MVLDEIHINSTKLYEFGGTREFQLLENVLKGASDLNSWIGRTIKLQVLCKLPITQVLEAPQPTEFFILKRAIYILLQDLLKYLETCLCTKCLKNDFNQAFLKNYKIVVAVCHLIDCIISWVLISCIYLEFIMD